MRIAVVVGADRANDDPNRTFQRCYRRPLAARRPELTVARPVLRRHHVVVDEDDLSTNRGVGCEPERIDAVEIGDLTDNPEGGCGCAVTQRSDDQLLREWRFD